MRFDIYVASTISPSVSPSVSVPSDRANREKIKVKTFLSDQVQERL